MKQLFYILLLAPLLWIPGGCREAQLPEYDEPAGLYFHRESGTEMVGTTQRDSTTFAFYVKQVKADSTYVQPLRILLVGFPVPYPRTFKLEQSNAGTPNAAVAGLHYVSLDDPGMTPYLVIQADSTGCTVPITCINHESLSSVTEPVRLNIQICENENFKVGIHAQSSFLIKYADIAIRPNSWIDRQFGSDWRYHFGLWSAVKMRYVSLVCGFSDFDAVMENTIKVEKDFFAKKVYRALKEYNDAHPGDPMRDENGNLIIFPEMFAD